MLKIRMVMLFIFVLLLPLNTVKAQNSNFTDLNGHWAESLIRDWIVKGWVNGYEDGTFKPNGGISRGELVSVINKAFGFQQKALLSFTDVKYRDWFSDDIAKAVYAGYVSGYTDNTFHPSQHVTRQELAAMVDHIVNIPSTKHGMIHITDLEDISLWAVRAVESVLDKKIMVGYDDESFKPNRVLTRAETVSALSHILDMKVSGSIKDQSGKTLSNGTLYITNKDEMQGINVQIRNGEFIVYLPFGDYKINRVYDYTSKKEDYLGYTFSTISNDKHQPLELNVSLKAANVLGYLRDDEGNPIPNVTLTAHYSVNKPGVSGGGSIQFLTDDQGYFEKHLSAGNYTFTYFSYGEGTPTKFVPFYHQFTIKENDQVISPLMTASGFYLNLQKSNVIGTAGIKRKNGNITPVSGYITIHSKADSGWYFTTITNGNFDVYLPSGTYVIHDLDVYKSSDYYRLEQEFTINEKTINEQPFKLELVSEE